MVTGNYGRAARLGRKMAVLASVICAGAAVAPAMASAAVHVNNMGTGIGPPNTCAVPTFTTIQAAVTATPATTEILVCSGTYKEQVVIEKGQIIKGTGGLVTVTLPAVPSLSTTSCDGSEEEDVVTVCAPAPEAVTITALTIEGSWPAAQECAKRFFGVLVGGGASLKLIASDVVHAGPSVNNGCQQGVGVQVGRVIAPPATVGTATLTSDTISGYQKNGITVDGAGSKAFIKNVTVTGAGITDKIAQNGIEIARGAVGKISGSTISANECEVPPNPPTTIGCSGNTLTTFQATGVLFLEEGKGSSVSTSTVAENDVGVYHLAGVETGKPQAAIAGNELVANRYEGVVLDQGFATVNKDKITGPGNVGIQLVQHEGQPFGPKGTGKEDVFKGMTEWAIEGLSDLEPGDKFGKFKISTSKISGNPGATPATSVTTNNPSKLPIILGAGNT